MQSPMRPAGGAAGRRPLEEFGAAERGLPAAASLADGLGLQRGALLGGRADAGAYEYEAPSFGEDRERELGGGGGGSGGGVAGEWISAPAVGHEASPLGDDARSPPDPFIGGEGSPPEAAGGAADFYDGLDARYDGAGHRSLGGASGGVGRSTPLSGGNRSRSSMHASMVSSASGLKKRPVSPPASSPALLGSAEVEQLEGDLERHPEHQTWGAAHPHYAEQVADTAAETRRQRGASKSGGFRTKFDGGRSSPQKSRPAASRSMSPLQARQSASYLAAAEAETVSREQQRPPSSRHDVLSGPKTPQRTAIAQPSSLRQQQLVDPDSPAAAEIGRMRERSSQREPVRSRLGGEGAAREEVMRSAKKAVRRGRSEFSSVQQQQVSTSSERAPTSAGGVDVQRFSDRCPMVSAPRSAVSPDRWRAKPGHHDHHDPTYERLSAPMDRRVRASQKIQKQFTVAHMDDEQRDVLLIEIEQLLAQKQGLEQRLLRSQHQLGASSGRADPHH